VFELLVVLTLLAGQEGKVLLLDEPALNLHPTMQVELRKILEESASTNQILVVTHSPLLVSLDYSDHTWRLSYGADGTNAIGLRELGTPAEVRRRIGGAITEEKLGTLLFASGVVAVEGPGDKYATEEFDMKLGKKGAQLKEDNWVVISPGGKDSIGVVMDISRKLGIPSVALTDKDGIMECKSTVKYGEAQRSLPNILSSAIEGGMVSETDRAALISFPMSGDHYADTVFEKVREIADRNNIFALPGTLEDALGVKKRSRKNRRMVFDRVRETRAGKVPPEFIQFFKFVKERKERARSGKKGTL
jgi:energy-coupling factor transporter ATP-binding protein EcfA2